MKRTDFHYELPERLIAQYPLPERSASRLLQLDRRTGRTRDLVFSELPTLLAPGDLLVWNDTRVIPARLFATKESGGKVEILLERLTDELRCLAQLRASKSPRTGSRLLLKDGTVLRVCGRSEGFYELELETEEHSLAELIEKSGHVPLPPYIQRADQPEDRDRYQTVYARSPGAVAAPTAGLHFDQALLKDLRDRGIETAELTLHIGAATFQPVRSEHVEDHRMHAEYLEVGEQCCAAVRAARQRGSRIVAVGTTAVRGLETAACNGPGGDGLRPYLGESSLFIHPGYRFRVIDGMITNFHLPESTLLMLVCAFAGVRETLAAYRHAVEHEYRFFSYGDAMLVA